MLGFPLAVHLVTGAPLDWRVPTLERFNYLGGIYLPISFVTMLVGLSIYHSAHKAEAVRAGIQSVQKGQMEAAQTIGLRRSQALRLVLIPLAMRAIIPPLGNDFIAILKDTSLLSVLGVLEITQRGRQFSASTFKFREGYFVVSFIYLLLTLSLSLLLSLLERRMTRDRKGER